MANTEERKTLGMVIRDARVANDHGWSLRDFAKLLEITPSYQSDIENDRRVPAEEVLKKTADLLGLKFEDLMALAGRLGEDAERYLRRQPAAGALFRKLTEANAPEELLRKMIEEAEEQKRKKKKEGGG
jgi:transcriptional regulator with XRE-family HTH domain